MSKSEDLHKRFIKAEVAKEILEEKKKFLISSRPEHEESIISILQDIESRIKQNIDKGIAKFKVFNAHYSKNDNLKLLLLPDIIKFLENRGYKTEMIVNKNELEDVDIILMINLE